MGIYRNVRNVSATQTMISRFPRKSQSIYIRSRPVALKARRNLSVSNRFFEGVHLFETGLLKRSTATRDHSLGVTIGRDQNPCPNLRSVVVDLEVHVSAPLVPVPTRRDRGGATSVAQDTRFDGLALQRPARPISVSVQDGGRLAGEGAREFGCPLALGAGHEGARRGAAGRWPATPAAPPWYARGSRAVSSTIAAAMMSRSASERRPRP